jgi:hypothetical protein
VMERWLIFLEEPRDLGQVGFVFKGSREYLFTHEDEMERSGSGGRLGCRWLTYGAERGGE